MFARPADWVVYLLVAVWGLFGIYSCVAVGTWVDRVFGKNDDDTKVRVAIGNTEQEGIPILVFVWGICVWGTIYVVVSLFIYSYLFDG
jgi:hypothetical protein